MSTVAFVGSIERSLAVETGDGPFTGTMGANWVPESDAAVIVNPDQVRSRLELVTLLTALKAAALAHASRYALERLWPSFFTLNQSGFDHGHGLPHDEKRNRLLTPIDGASSEFFIFAGNRDHDPRVIARSPKPCPIKGVTGMALLVSADRNWTYAMGVAAIEAVAGGLIDYANENPGDPLADLFVYH